MDPAEIYQRLRLTPEAPPPNSKVGVSQSALAGELPLHGLRHRPASDTNGWYLWAGEYSDAEDFRADACRAPRRTLAGGCRVPRSCAGLAVSFGTRARGCLERLVPYSTANSVNLTVAFTGAVIDNGLLQLGINPEGI